MWQSVRKVRWEKPDMNICVGGLSVVHVSASPSGSFSFFIGRSLATRGGWHGLHRGECFPHFSEAHSTAVITRSVPFLEFETSMSLRSARATSDTEENDVTALCAVQF